MLASNKPKMPILYRIRTDVSWDDVVSNWKERIVTPMARSIRRLAPKQKRKIWIPIVEKPLGKSDKFSLVITHSSTIPFRHLSLVIVSAEK